MDEIVRRFGEYMETAREIVVSIEGKQYKVGFTLTPEAVYDDGDNLRVDGEQGAVLEIAKDNYKVSYEKINDLYTLRNPEMQIELEFI